MEDLDKDPSGVARPKYCSGCKDVTDKQCSQKQKNQSSLLARGFVFESPSLSIKKASFHLKTESPDDFLQC